MPYVFTSIIKSLYKNLKIYSYNKKYKPDIQFINNSNFFIIFNELFNFKYYLTLYRPKNEIDYLFSKVDYFPKKYYDNLISISKNIPSKSKTLGNGACLAMSIDLIKYYLNNEKENFFPIYMNGYTKNTIILNNKYNYIFCHLNEEIKNMGISKKIIYNIYNKNIMDEYKIKKLKIDNISFFNYVYIIDNFNIFNIFFDNPIKTLDVGIYLINIYFEENSSYHATVLIINTDNIQYYDSNIGFFNFDKDDIKKEKFKDFYLLLFDKERFMTILKVNV